MFGRIKDRKTKILDKLAELDHDEPERALADEKILTKDALLSKLEEVANTEEIFVEPGS